MFIVQSTNMKKLIFSLQQIVCLFTIMYYTWFQYHEILSIVAVLSAFFMKNKLNQGVTLQWEHNSGTGLLSDLTGHLVNPRSVSTVERGMGAIQGHVLNSVGPTCVYPLYFMPLFLNFSECKLASFCVVVVCQVLCLYARILETEHSLHQFQILFQLSKGAENCLQMLTLTLNPQQCRWTVGLGLHINGLDLI